MKYTDIIILGILYFPNVLGIFINNTQYAHITGLRYEGDRFDVWNLEGIPQILSYSQIEIRLFGNHLNNDTEVRFVSDEAETGGNCDPYDFTASKNFTVVVEGSNATAATVQIDLPMIQPGYDMYYICVRENGSSWIHQGSKKWISITTYENTIPYWLQWVFVIILLFFSGLFSGLILGLLSMSKTEIKILMSSGNETERRYATKIFPVRDRGNFLLCSLVLGNVTVTVTLTLVMNLLTSILISVVASTILIVIFGEILPQSFCARHRLTVGYKTLWITKFIMFITCPISFPMSWILDKVLGQEISDAYSRDKIKELLRVTRNDLQNDEVNIISGALDLNSKSAYDIMTELDDAFMLPEESILDFETIREIVEKGFSRIPVYKGERANITSILYSRDLAFVDPRDKMPLKAICDFYNKSIYTVSSNTTLDIIFKEFKIGHNGRMAFVRKEIITNGKASGVKVEIPEEGEIIGLLTLEDIIETLVQEDDENDVDIRLSKARGVNARASKRFKFPTITSKNAQSSAAVHISQQLVLAAYQYLSTSVELFNNSFISPTILQRLLQQNIFEQIKVKSQHNHGAHDHLAILYERGKPSDYFILILEGRVQVEVGRDNMIFESGPFTFFGNQSLVPSIGANEIVNMSANTNQRTRKISYASFVPDYTVRASTNVSLIRITRNVYLAARQATLLERSIPHGEDEAGKQGHIIDVFQEQINKIMSGHGLGLGHKMSREEKKMSRDEKRMSLCQELMNATGGNLTEIILNNFKIDPVKNECEKGARRRVGVVDNATAGHTNPIIHGRISLESQNDQPSLEKIDENK